MSLSSCEKAVYHLWQNITQQVNGIFVMFQDISIYPNH